MDSKAATVLSFEREVPDNVSIFAAVMKAISPIKKMKPG
jgi:hypothetical protein